MRTLAVGLVALLSVPVFGADAPEPYRSVTSVHWVVRDVDRVASGWARLGFPPLQEFGQVSIPVRYRGVSSTSVVRVVRAEFDGLDVFWIQPVSGRNAWSDFLDEHGEGIVSANYTLGSSQALDREAARLEELGVAELQTLSVAGGDGPLRVVYMDTAADGKYLLGLTSGSLGPPPKAPPPTPFGARLSQYALVVKDLQAVSEYWQRLGIPAMEVTHPTLSDLEYHGEPGHFDQRLGWHRHGTVTWEWITPLAGPTVYEDFLKAHGEGFHHLAFDVPDIDAVARAWTALGYPIVQSGAWGERGRPGSGRFAYADTTPIGGVTIELLWNHPAAPD